MVKKQDNFNIMTVKPTPGKAAIVVARTTNFGGAINFFTHIDKSIIGVTRGTSCIYKSDIEPGLHYLIARSESLETGKIQFESDTVYYIQESPRIGWWVARITLTPLTREQLLSEIGDSGCTLYENDKEDLGDDLSDEEYNEAVTDYEREIKEGYHGDFTAYRGLKVQQ
jgi:hypothetical protein